MADITKLKPKASDKGAPPPTELGDGKGRPPMETNENLSAQPREVLVKKTKMEFSVPADMADAFSLAAGQRFGFKKGSKSELFIAMWKEYKDLQVG